MWELWVNWKKRVLCFIWNFTKSCSLFQKIMFSITIITCGIWVNSSALHIAVHIAYFIFEIRMYPYNQGHLRDSMKYSTEYWLVCICSCCFHFLSGFLWQLPNWSPYFHPTIYSQESPQIFLLKCRSDVTLLCWKPLNVALFYWECKPS